VVDLDAFPIIIAISQFRLSWCVPSRRGALEKLECLLKVLLEIHVTIAVRASKNQLRRGVPVVRVVLHPAQPLGI